MNQSPKRASGAPAASKSSTAPVGASKPSSAASQPRLIELLGAIRIELTRIETGLVKERPEDTAEGARHALVYIEELAAVLEAPSVDALGRRRRRQVHILTAALTRYAEGAADDGAVARAALIECREIPQA